MPLKTNECEDEQFDKVLQEKDKREIVTPPNLNVQRNSGTHAVDDYDVSQQRKLVPNNVINPLQLDDKKGDAENNVNNSEDEMTPLLTENSSEYIEKGFLCDSVNCNNHGRSCHSETDVNTDRSTKNASKRMEHDPSDRGSNISKTYEDADRSTVVHINSCNESARFSINMKKTADEPSNDTVEKHVTVTDSSNENNENVKNCRKLKIKKKRLCGIFKSGVMIIFAISISYLLYVDIVNKNSNSKLQKQGLYVPDLKNKQNTVQIAYLGVDWSLQNVSATENINISLKCNNQSIIRLDDEGSSIYFKQNSTYIIGLSLNIDTSFVRQTINTDRFIALICLRNSRHQDERCQRQSLAPNTGLTVSIQSTVSLWEGDKMWVSVVGMQLIYKNSVGNRLDIVKFPTFSGG